MKNKSKFGKIKEFKEIIKFFNNKFTKVMSKFNNYNLVKSNYQNHQIN